VSEQEHAPRDFPGFLRSAEGGYLKIEDFLTFVSGASSAKGDTKARAMAWLKRQGITGPVEALSPVEVSRLTEAARQVILARKGREKRELTRPEEVVPPSGSAADADPPDKPE